MGGNMKSNEARLLENRFECPVCESEDLRVVGSEEISDKKYSKEIECADCESFWTEVYSLVEIIDFNKGDS
jgi:transcription elongation factor Elf1